MTQYTGPDTVVAPLINLIVDKQAQYALMAGKLKAAEGNRDAALRAWVLSSDHKEAVKLRNVIEQANAKLKELAEQNVPKGDLSDEEKNTLRNELDVLKAKIRDGRKAILTTAETTGFDTEGVQKFLTETAPDPTHSGRGRKPGSTNSNVVGSTGPRYSATHVVSGGNLDNVTFDTFAHLAKGLGQKQPDLVAAFAAHNGVEPNELTQKVKESVTWTYVSRGADGNTDNGTEYTIVTTPKPRGKKSADNADKADKPAA